MALGGRIPAPFYDEALSLALKGVGVRNMNARERIVSPLFRLKLRGAIRGFSVSSGTARRVAAAAGAEEPAPFEPPVFEPPVLGGALGPQEGKVLEVSAVSMHFAGDPLGGAPDDQVRVFGPIARPFRISQIQLYPVGAVQVGAFFDLLVSDDGSRTNIAAPTGSSVFELGVGPAETEAIDLENGLQIPDRPVFLTLTELVRDEGKFLKGHLFIRSPATAPPDVHVVLLVEQLELEPAAA